jgi:uncharacterized protein DUF6976
MNMRDELTLGCGRLMDPTSAANLIRGGGYYTLAGDEKLLRSLPMGNWIGGTIPYFMGEQGGEATRDKVFVTAIPVLGEPPTIRCYDVTNLSRVCADGPANGYTMMILPAFSAVHSLYARNAPGFEDMFVKPVVGWVAGIHLDDMGKAEPGVMNGQTGRFETECAVVMHVPLPSDYFAQVDIINGMVPGNGDRIRFMETGFSAGECLINDQPANLADYLERTKADFRLPLVADYSGAMINVSLKGVDPKTRRVEFYAPVFEGMEYRFAAAPGELPAIDADEGQEARFSCNCILNYLYGSLEGKHTGYYTGPMTFGEIAYLLLNQTLVHLTIARA